MNFYTSVSHSKLNHYYEWHYINNLALLSVEILQMCIKGVE